METEIQKNVKSNFLKNIQKLTDMGYNIDITTIKEDSFKIDSFTVECKIFKIFRYVGSSGMHIEDCLNKKDAEQIIWYHKTRTAKLNTAFDTTFEIREDRYYINSWDAKLLTEEVKMPAKRKVV